MKNYSQMIKMNRLRNEEKKILAINTIWGMLNNNERISVGELTKITGLSRTLFYKNKEVNAELIKAMKAQQGKLVYSRREKTLCDALMATVKVQKEEINKLRAEIEILSREKREMEHTIQSREDFDYVDKLRI